MRLQFRQESQWWKAGWCRLMQTATVSVFSGCGSVLRTDRHAPERSPFSSWLVSFLSFPISFMFSLILTHALLFCSLTFRFLKFPDVAIATLKCFHFPHLVSLWQTARQPIRQKDRKKDRQIGTIYIYIKNQLMDNLSSSLCLGSH